jgi:outer membrane protein TolC
LYSREQGLRLAAETLKIAQERYEDGRASPSDVAQARGQYELFRSQRLTAIETVLDDERQLRALMGMMIEDGTRFVPADAPSVAEHRPDWDKALKEALARRPELWLARQDVKAKQLNLLQIKNRLLPDPVMTASYDPNGIGKRLDGDETTNALHTLPPSHGNGWSTGLKGLMPGSFQRVGLNVRPAELDPAELELARSREVLQDYQRKTERFLGLQYRRMASQYQQIKAQRGQCEAFADQLKARTEEYAAGRGTLDILLESQRFWADAVASEFAAVVAYQNARTGFSYAKGAIMRREHVVLAKEAAPEDAQVRAVEHERKRTEARVAHVEPLPHGAVVLPEKGRAPSLAALWKTTPLGEHTDQ